MAAKKKGAPSVRRLQDTLRKIRAIANTPPGDDLARALLDIERWADLALRPKKG